MVLGKGECFEEGEGLDLVVMIEDIEGEDI